MNKSNLIILLIVVVIASLIIAGIMLVNLGEDQVPAGELHTFPLSVEEQTYVRARLICRQVAISPAQPFFLLISAVI